ncbi:hypothetical protein LUZ60_008245 [Juncus effusus]|nr:hypothetical protein LUZ60_008245 [Juncus effusus]
MGNLTVSMNLNEIFSQEDDDDDQTTEVVFAADEIAGGGEAAGEMARMRDQELREKIQRVKSHLTDPSLNLPDGGEKVRRMLKDMEDERDRRRSRAGSDQSEKENGACIKASKPTTPGPYDWIDDTDVLYGKKYESYRPLTTTKYYRKSGSAFTKELSVVSGQKRKTTEKVNLIRSSSKEWPSRSFSDEIHEENNSIKKERASRSFFDEGRSQKMNSSCGFGKRRKVTKTLDPIDLADEDSDVVLLEDEDVQTLDLDPPVKEIPDKWKECKMYYPSRNDPDSVELTHSDVKCLNPAEYLSSPVMNFYIQYLKRSICRDSKQSFYIFNTYFYQKLEDAFNAEADNDLFMKLRRWWKGVNIFEKAYIILPIHGRMHWSLIIICIPTEESKSGPFILHLDSLGCHSSQTIFDRIEWFLRKEYKHVGKSSPENFISKIHKEKVSVPQQKNEYDCGLFVLYFTERFIREAPDRYTLENISMFNRKWFKSEEASRLRERIRALLIEELESVRLEENEDDIKSDSISDISDSD